MNKIIILLVTLALPSASVTSLSAQDKKQIRVDNQSFWDMNEDGKLQPYEDTRLPNNKRVTDLLARLSTEDKINLVLGTGMIGFEEQLSGFNEINPVVGSTDFLVPGAAGTTTPLRQFGLPAIVMTDGPAGVRINPIRKNDSKTYYATGFPVGISLASTWNVDLVEKVGEAIGNEALEYDSDIQLAPALNIMRNPLCGRNFEYYSEDPVISGKIAAAATLGIQKHGIGVSIKHFTANNSEKNRMAINIHVSQRALREIYLRGFEIAVKEANPYTVMSSYNLVNNLYTSANYDLLTTILRDEWGFKGLVMTDWFGGYSKGIGLGANGIELHFKESNTSKQISAGNDLLMPGIIPQKKDLENDIKTGSLPIKDLDICVSRILHMIFNAPKMNNFTPSNAPDLRAHAQIARQAAAEGMVLLENRDSTLPIKQDYKNLAVFGSISYDFIAGGTGSGGVNKAYTISLIQGLKEHGYNLDPNICKIYEPFVKNETQKLQDLLKITPFMPIGVMPQPKLKDAAIKASAKVNDIAIITLGRSSAESKDRDIETDYHLTNEEQEFIDKVSTIYHAEGKKVVVVLNHGGVLETPSWNNKADAILLAWMPGQEGGYAVTDILSGKVNPSGKLTATFPVNYTDIPCSTPEKFQGIPLDDPKDLNYEEGIYVGYRYFSTFNIKPAYEFGYGLSYTTFDFSNIKINNKNFNKEIYISVDVKNTGSVAGKEVVQLYLSAPKGQIDKPVKELKAFAKTRLLNPGETQTIMLKLTAKDLASFNQKEVAWIADKGTYNVLIGQSSENISAKATFSVTEDIIVEKVNNVLNNTASFRDLNPE